MPAGPLPGGAGTARGETDTAALHRRLAAVDPLAASRMEPSNRRRVIRALEVTIGSGRPFSSFGPGVAEFPATTWRIAGAVAAPVGRGRPDPGPAGRHAPGRAGRRGGDPSDPAGGLSRTARQALGYREVLAHLEDGVPLDDGGGRGRPAHPGLRPPPAGVVAAGPPGAVVRGRR